MVREENEKNENESEDGVVEQWFPTCGLRAKSGLPGFK